MVNAKLSVKSGEINVAAIGEVGDILTEVTMLIVRIYKPLAQDNKAIADLFLESLTRTLSDPKFKTSFLDDDDVEDGDGNDE